MTETHLAPCPFCGLTDRDSVSPEMEQVPAVGLHAWPQDKFTVCCIACGGDGPSSPTSEEAIARWNRGRCGIGGINVDALRTPGLKAAIVDLLDPIYHRADHQEEFIAEAVADAKRDLAVLTGQK